MNNICPVGFFCFDKNTFCLVIITLIIIVVFLIYQNKNKFMSEKKDFNFKLKLLKQKLKLDKKKIENINYEQNNSETKDIERIINPLRPPERSYTGSGVKINIPTRGYVPHYQQVGALIEETNSDSKVLPLFGKPTYPSSRKWLYYTSSDNYSSVKLPVNSNNRCCLDEYGCDELYNDSIVTVDGYSNSFKVNLYKLDKPRYIPYI